MRQRIIRSLRWLPIVVVALGCGPTYAPYRMVSQPSSLGEVSSGRASELLATIKVSGFIANPERKGRPFAVADGTLSLRGDALSLHVPCIGTRGLRTACDLFFTIPIAPDTWTLQSVSFLGGEARMQVDVPPGAYVIEQGCGELFEAEAAPLQLVLSPTDGERLIRIADALSRDQAQARAASAKPASDHASGVAAPHADRRKSAKAGSPSRRGRRSARKPAK